MESNRNMWKQNRKWRRQRIRAGKKYCRWFCAVMHYIMLIEKEEAVTCARKVAGNYNFIFLDKDNMLYEINKLSTEDKLLLTSKIFRPGKESMKTDILPCSQTYKNLPAMFNVTPHTRNQARNSILHGQLMPLATKVSDQFIRQ